MPARRSEPDGIRRRAIAWGVISLALFSLARLGVQTSDDAATLATAGALWDHHTVAIPHMEWLDGRVDIGRQGPDGRLYAKYGLGQALVGAVLYGLGERLLSGSGPFMWAGYALADSAAGAEAAQLANVLPGSATVALVAAQAGGPAAAFLALASPWWLAGRGFGSEVGAGLGLLLGAVWARRACRGGPLWPSALWLAVAALFRPSALAFGLAWVVWLRGRPWREWVAVGGVLAGAVLLLGAYNFLRYGSLLEFGYGQGGSGFGWQPEGLVGYLVAPGRGLLVFAPWTLLVGRGGIEAVRRRQVWKCGALLGMAAFYVVHALWKEWAGGWAYGPRLLVPLLPVAAVCAADERPGGPLAGAMFAVGFLVQALTLPQDPIRTHLAAIGGGQLAFEQTVWSLRDNIVLLQARMIAQGR